MTAQAFERDGTLLWVMLLTATSTVATLAFACVAPFVALAVFAATRLPARGGFALIVLVWIANQAIGFGVLRYPGDATTIAWGFGILSAALAGGAAARWGNRAVAGTHSGVRLATTFGTAFVAYKAMLLAWSLVLGGVHTALSPYWTLRQFGLEAVFLVGLVALYRLLTIAGVPASDRLRARV